MSSDSYGARPTIEDVKAVQARMRRPAYHVVWFDEEGFVMAHTDQERAFAPVVPLEDCELHQDLVRADVMPVHQPGYYLWLPGWEEFVRLPVE